MSPIPPSDPTPAPPPTSRLDADALDALVQRILEAHAVAEDFMLTGAPPMVWVEVLHALRLAAKTYDSPTLNDFVIFLTEELRAHGCQALVDGAGTDVYGTPLHEADWAEANRRANDAMRSLDSYGRVR